MNNEFIIKDEATTFTEKELRAAINRLKAGGRFFTTRLKPRGLFRQGGLWRRRMLHLR